MASPPVANPDPGVVAVLSTDKGKGEASKSASSSSAAAASSVTAKAREPVHIILHLRGGGGQLSHSRPIEPPRQHPLNTDTTTITTTSSPSSAAAAAEADSEEAWWKIPYNTSMPIPKSFFLASREYLLGHQTVDQLTQTHGVPPSLFQPALEHGVVVFVGLAIPGLQPVLRNEEACARLRKALTLLDSVNPDDAAANKRRTTAPAAESLFLERLKSENPAFARLVRDQGVRARFMEGLGQYVQDVRF